MQAEQECPCPNADCERRGDCVVCFKHHASRQPPELMDCMRQESAVSKELLERIKTRLRKANMAWVDDHEWH